MSAGRALVRLYPRAFRERFADEMAEEIDRAGRRSWPDVVLSAARMWAQPVLWPAGTGAQRRARGVVAGVTFALTAGWVLQLLLEFDGRAGRWVDVGQAALLTGMALLTPRPTRVVAATASAARRLAAPASLAALVVCLAAGSSLRRDDQPLAGIVLVLWWAALAWGAAAFAGAVHAALGSGSAVPPSATRSRLGLLVVAGATGILAACLLAATDVGAVAGGVVLTGVALAAAQSAHDLGSLPAPAR